MTCSGYMAPEYARHGKLSTKLDVFSFGVVILEIVSGKKNSGFRIGESVEHLLSFVSLPSLSCLIRFTNRKLDII